MHQTNIRYQTDNQQYTTDNRSILTRADKWQRWIGNW